MRNVGRGVSSRRFWQPNTAERLSESTLTRKDYNAIAAIVRRGRQALLSLVPVDSMQFLWTTFERAPAWLLVAVVRLYQLLISPGSGRNCRYEPSCSNYMIQAVHKYGVVRGAWRGLRRIARCHPLGCKRLRSAVS